MDKIDRKYELVYVKDSGLPTERRITVKPPFTIEVNITRNNFSSSNIGQIRIYNLSKDQRKLMRKDWQAFTLRDQVILKAGYGDELVEILNMFVSKAFSIHEGVNFITQIECLDGGFAYLNAKIESTYPTGTPIRNMIEDQVGKLEPFGVGRGVVGSFPGEIQRGQSYAGNTLDNLKTITGGAAFIDNGKINVLKNNEAIKGNVLLVNSKTGLLKTPVRQRTYVEFELIFEPQISIGRLIELESDRGDEDINQQYIVNYLSHRGTFSETVKGSVVTQVGCFPGTFSQVGTN